MKVSTTNFVLKVNLKDDDDDHLWPSVRVALSVCVRH